MRRLICLFCLLWAVISAQGQAKYIFYFIGDGMGVNQVNGTEMFRAEAMESRIGTKSLLFTQFPAGGVVSTYSATNPVTDSAAGGTALATGEKTYNGAIGVSMNKQALVSIAEYAKKLDKKVGIATSVSIDHATPGAFYAHQPDRKMFYEIACDLPKAGFDFYAGSGFLSPEKKSDGKDAQSIFQILDKAGYIVARGIDNFREQVGKADKMVLMQQEGKPVLSLPYAIDRKKGDLTLAEITKSAIQFLTKDGDKGFFLMIEGGKIDWACHSNDAATTFWEVEDFDSSISVAYDFYKRYPEETLIVITADHETGGIVLGTKKYNLNLQALKHQKCSIETLSRKISQLRKNKKKHVDWKDIKNLLSEEMGFWSELTINPEQENLLKDAYETSFVKNNVKLEENLYSKNEPLAVCARKIMNQIAIIGWAGGTHSAGYVPVFAVGVGAEQFCGKMDNVDIPNKIKRLMK